MCTLPYILEMNCAVEPWEFWKNNSALSSTDQFHSGRFVQVKYQFPAGLVESGHILRCKCEAMLTFMCVRGGRRQKD